MKAPQEPFRGGCERFITTALKVHGRSKKDLFVTNIVHCHPPNNRASRNSEIENCRRYLHRELDLVRPRLAIGLGRDERAHAVLMAEYPDTTPLEWWADHVGSSPAATRPAGAAGIEMNPGLLSPKISGYGHFPTSLG